MTSGTTTVAGRSLQRGTKNCFLIPLVHMSIGSDLLLPLNVIVGKRPGPRLILVFCQHGDESLPLQGWFELFNRLDPAQVAGELVGIPVASPMATAFNMRNSLPDALGGDHGNMNRAWPGREDGWLTERITHRIGEDVLPGASCVIDFHDGSAGGLHIYYGYLPSGDTPVDAESARLSQAFGMEILISKSLTYRGTLKQYLTEKGIPSVGVEIGQFYGFDGLSPRAPAEVTATGIQNVMKLTGMMDGEPVLPKRQAVVYPETRVKSVNGGLLLARVTDHDIGQMMPAARTLFEIVDVAKQEVIEAAHGPFGSNMLLTAPPNATFVNPGDQCCHVADAGTLEWIVNA